MNTPRLLRRRAVAAAASALLAGIACAQPAAPIRLLDDFALSPDGRTLAFSWRGDVWTVPSAGGTARRLTFHPAPDVQPRYAPDGRTLAFVSERTRSHQVFTMPAEGGPATQVTLHTEGYALAEWTPDGQGFLVRAARDHFWDNPGRFFVQSLDGRRAPKLLFDDYAASGTLSPDGRRLLFTREDTGTYRKRYRGSQESQLWLFDRELGAFTRLVHVEGGCRWPLWHPDGRSFYFASQKTGAWNLYRHHLDGNGDGALEGPLTRFEDDGVLHPAISRDGSAIVFARLFELHRFDTATGRTERIEILDGGDRPLDPLRRETVNRATDAAFTDDGREIAFTAAGDVWVMDTVLGEPVRVTDTPEEERDPVFSPDGETLVFASDAGGRADLWTAVRADATRYWWQQAAFTLARITEDEEVESAPRFHDEGKRVAFVRGKGDVVSIRPDGGDAKVLLRSWNRPDFEISPDGKWIVYAVQDEDYNSDVWIKPLDDHREPYNLSCHPDNDRDPTWSPDGRVIAFTGRRWGEETDVAYVWLAKEKDEETERQRKIEKALEKMKSRAKGKEPAAPAGGKPAARGEPASRAEPAAAPRPEIAIVGKWTGTITGASPIPPAGLPFELTIEVDDQGRFSGNVNTVMGEGEIQSGSYDPATGKVEIKMVFDAADGTVAGTVKDGKGSGTWTIGDQTGEWTATRISPGEITRTAAAAKDAEKPKAEAGREAKKPEVVIDFEGLRDRVRRISIPDSTERGLLWAPEGLTLAFTATVGGKTGVHTVTLPDELTPKLVAESRPLPGRWLKEGNQIVGLSGGRPASMTAQGKTTTYEVSCRVATDLAARNRAVFEQAWRTMRDQWYDERLGNNNWDAIRRKYEGVAADCLTEDEVSTVVNMMLGELNGSHLGFRMAERGGGGGPPAERTEWTEVTGHLGARFDPDHRGPGLLIKDVVEGTPADREDSKLKKGEVVLAVDGKTVDPDVEIATVMTGRPDRDVELKVRGEGGAVRTVRIRPASYGLVRFRLYDAWTEANHEKVEELSGGRFGYVHIQAMGGPNLVSFDAELYRIGYGKEGLVIDVRENGGGSITDHLLTCLTQPRHAITRTRGGPEGYPHDRRVYATWEKPIVVLCNQNSFSNAEIFSHAIKTLGRGRIVGVPTAGGVISTGGTSLMGLATLRLPTRGWYTLDGEDMELHGCVPHHVLWPEPGEMPAGVDRQLARAVEVLEEDVAAWRARPKPALRKASER